jgi:hypothetical protein
MHCHDDVPKDKLLASDESASTLFDLALTSTLDTAFRDQIRWLEGAVESDVKDHCSSFLMKDPEATRSFRKFLRGA